MAVEMTMVAGLAEASWCMLVRGTVAADGKITEPTARPLSLAFDGIVVIGQREGWCAAGRPGAGQRGAAPEVRLEGKRGRDGASFDGVAVDDRLYVSWPLAVQGWCNKRQTMVESEGWYGVSTFLLLPIPHPTSPFHPFSHLPPPHSHPSLRLGGELAWRDGTKSHRTSTGSSERRHARCNRRRCSHGLDVGDDGVGTGGRHRRGRAIAEDGSPTSIDRSRLHLRSYILGKAGWSFVAALKSAGIQLTRTLERDPSLPPAEQPSR